MAEALDKNLIMVLIIVGAAAVVAMGYGMHRAMATRKAKNGSPSSFKECNTEQDQYMIDLRMAHRDKIMAEATYAPRPAHASLSTAY